MNAPQINTAIPKRRYQLGDFAVTSLVSNRYLLAPSPLEGR